MSQDPIVIVGAARTPMGSFQSDFASLSAHDLGGAAIKAAVERAGVPDPKVTELPLGQLLPSLASGQLDAAYVLEPAPEPFAEVAARHAEPGEEPHWFWSEFRHHRRAFADRATLARLP